MNATHSSHDLELAKSYINNLSFAPIIDKLTRQDTHITNIKNVWSRKKAEYYVQQYKNYLFLLKKYSSQYKHIPPSKDIDEIWHHHILDTKKYHEDCTMIFNHYLHHDPYFGLSGSKDEAKLFNSWETTQKLYLAEFGEYIYEYDEEEG